MYIFWWKLNSSGSMHIFHQPPNSGIVWTWLERFPYLILHQTTISTPTTTNTVPKNAGLENDISSKTSDVHWFSGFILVFRGVDPLIVFYTLTIQLRTIRKWPLQSDSEDEIETINSGERSGFFEILPRDPPLIPKSLHCRCHQL